MSCSQSRSGDCFTVDETGARTQGSVRSGSGSGSGSGSAAFNELIVCIPLDIHYDTGDAHFSQG